MRPAGENTKQTLLSDYGISSSPKAVKAEAGSTKLVEVKLEPGVPPKVARLEDGRRGSDEGGKRKLTGCRSFLKFLDFIESFSFTAGVETQHFVLASSPAVVSDVLAMLTISLVLIANVKGVGTHIGNIEIAEKLVNSNLQKVSRD